MRQTTFYMDEEVLDRAKALGINCSEVARRALADAVARAEMDKLMERIGERPPVVLPNGVTTAELIDEDAK